MGTKMRYTNSNRSVVRQVAIVVLIAWSATSMAAGLDFAVSDDRHPTVLGQLVTGPVTPPPEVDKSDVSYQFTSGFVSPVIADGDNANDPFQVVDRVTESFLKPISLEPARANAEAGSQILDYLHQDSARLTGAEYKMKYGQSLGFPAVGFSRNGYYGGHSLTEIDFQSSQQTDPPHATEESRIGYFAGRTLVERDFEEEQADASE